jgi:hypothetical protein
VSTYTIKANHHYDTRLFSSLPFLSSKPQIKRLVTFDTSCAYTLPAYYSQDVNKLLGLAFGFRGVHYNSARFGWRYNASQDVIELLAYCYREGVKNWDAQLAFPLLATVKPGEPIELGLLSTADSYIFYTRKPGEATQLFSVKHEKQVQWFGYTLSLYFGGELTAPHDMQITMEKIS